MEDRMEDWDKRDPATVGHFIVTPIGSDGRQYWEPRMYPDWVVEGREHFAKWCAQEQLKCRSNDVRIVTCHVVEYAEESYETVVNSAFYNAEYFEQFPVTRPERY
jgi:hypothetical protein